MNLSLQGVPTPEIMEKVDKVKKMVIDDIYHPWRFWNYQIRAASMIRILDDTPLSITNAAHEISHIIVKITGNLWYATLASYIIGYDMAYRLRIQDMLNCLDVDSFSKSPQTELKRLWQIYLKRESIIPTYMVPKSKKVYNLLRFALIWPPFKRKVITALQSTNWEDITFTAEDREWIKHRIDYNFYA